jgi:hypothetical protein
LPGTATFLQLRFAADNPLRGYDPITFAVQDLDALTQWADALDTIGVTHSPISQAVIGHALDFSDPDGTKIRLYTQPTARTIADVVAVIGANAVGSAHPA